MDSLPQSFAALAAFNQWLCYKIVPSKRRAGKYDKFPMNPHTAKMVDAHDPANWVDYQTAIDTANLWGAGYGVAFVFTENDPFFFVDIDGAYNGQEWSTLATQLCQSFPGAAVEVSQSQTGLHIIGQYSGEEPDHACKNVPLGLELYTSGRFVALTGLNIQGDASTVCDASLASVIQGYFPATAADTVNASDWTSAPLEGFRPIEDDDELIKAACEAKSAASAFGKASFDDLWNRNVDALTNTYPDDVRDYDASQADGALAQSLVWWTCGDCERVERLMRQSGLARAKWDYHKKYLKMTITGALARSSGFYSRGKDLDIPDEPNTAQASETIRTGPQLMSIDQQIEYFRGCVYVCDMNRVFTPRGMMLKPDQFNAMYGGYIFYMDADGETTVKKAFDAFTNSQSLTFPKVDSTAFRPALPSGQIFHEEGLKLVNTYVPIETKRTHGDVTPFLTHLSKLLPDERDRVILLSYMAACIQYKGYKIQWAPLIQGVEGNGKTLLTRCVTHAIGERYSHMPPAGEISEKFNSWLFGKLFIGVEDIYVPNERNEILEVLKPMITNGRLAKRAMQTDQVMGDVCANFMFNSNHKDAVRKTQNDRRFAVFYTAQQESIHLARDGMTGDYFPNLYQWLNNGGYEAVAGYLESFAIPDEFNPTTNCQRAPDTSSTNEAVTMSMGPVEQEILEAVEEGRQGFAGGWVSSFALDKLLKDMRKDRQIPQNRRRALMQSIGYDYHPSLSQGRVNNPIAIDGGKPKLFTKVGHIVNSIEGAAEVARHYAAAQGDPLAQKSVDASVINS